jgi:DNA-binding MarR family transcriptional regulator
MAARPLPPEVLDDQLLTTMGLFMEAHAGLTATFERRLAAETGISGQPFEILLRLVRSPGHRLRMSDLAAQTTLTASGLTRAVDRLAREDLVRREACPEDRRVAYATLTEAGEARISCALPTHLAHLREVVDAALSPQEVEQLGALLRRLRDAVNPAAACASEPGGIPEGVTV